MIAKRSRFFLFLSNVFILIIFPPKSSLAQDDILHLIENGGFIVADGNNGLRYRDSELFIPASTMKILTSLVALDFFGSEFHFETHLFLDGRGNLYVKGYGDPVLTSEAVFEIGRKLRSFGVSQLQSVCLDESAFELHGETASEENSARAYDAPNGALSVNFNAVAVQVTKKGRILPADQNTPQLPLMREIGTGLAPGLHRININTLPAKPGKPPALRYTGELFIAELQKAGITIKQGWRIQTVPTSLQPSLIYRSQATLGETIKDCLKYSNNFVANQLFLAIGVKQYGLPGTWEKSRRVFRQYFEKKLGLDNQSLMVADGAGLLRQNRISPSAFIEVLNRFKPYASFLNERDTIPLKSGTLTGVYCYAGYFPKGDHLIPFALLLNQQNNTRKELLQALYKHVVDKEPNH